MLTSVLARMMNSIFYLVKANLWGVDKVREHVKISIFNGAKTPSPLTESFAKSAGFLYMISREKT